MGVYWGPLKGGSLESMQLLGAFLEIKIKIGVI